MVMIFSFSILYILKHRDQLLEKNSIVTFVIIVIIAVFFIPIMGLTGFHIVLVARGRTTNEQVTGKFRGGYNPFSKGCWRNVCDILCGPQYPRFRAPKRSKKKLSVAAPSVSARMTENQVKIYMDNTHSTTGSTYNKMSQRHGGDLSDMDVMLDSFDNTQSQSQDCEPSPPIPRHGSKTNFFSPGDTSTRTAYLLQQSSKPWSPYGSAGPPTPRAPRVPLGSAEDRNVPDGFPSWTFVNSPRSVRTPPRSLTSPVVNVAGDNYRTQPSPGSPASLTPGQSPAAAKRHLGSSRKGPPPHHTVGGGRNAQRPGSRNMSPQRKFASESELARAAADKANGNYEAARANQTADNIQELTDMEHYWDEGPHRFQHVLDRSGYRSSRNRTGASPQVGRRASEQLIKSPAPDASSPVKLHAAMRPVSFVKALELTEQTYGGSSKKTDPHFRQLTKAAQPSSNSEQEDRKSLYEMNYEISV